MAKGHHYTSYQKGIIKRYYEHKDDILNQRLGEIVSDLYLTGTPAKAARLWKSAHKALLGAGANKARVEKLVAERNVEALAALVNELF
jgi:hypothetical protein